MWADRAKYEDKMTIFSIICKTAGIGMFSDFMDKKLSEIDD